MPVRFITVVLAALVLASFISAGAGERLRVVSTLFPMYDFSRRIGGDRVDASMLLPPGADSHSYEPSPSDIAGIAKADLFIHAGAAMEPWAAKMLAAIADSGRETAVDASAGIDLVKTSFAEEDGHDKGDGHDEHDTHAIDPHFWLDPGRAATMADAILSAMITADPDNAGYYRDNADKLHAELKALDAEAEGLTDGAKRRVLVFGGRFAFIYFCNRYGLEHVGVYDFCGPGADPSLKRIIEVTDYVRAHRIPVVYHEEMVEPRIAKTIAAETGTVLEVAHSLHTISAAEMAAGLGYVDLMRRNIAAFRKGLE